MIATSSIWSFSTAGTAGPPAAPSTPTPVRRRDRRRHVARRSAGPPGPTGTTYNVAFGTTNPPPQVATGLSTPSYAPGTLAANTTYFWRVTAVSSGGSTAGPIWSFVTGTGSGGAPPPTS